jgi:hypothetical protein
LDEVEFGHHLPNHARVPEDEARDWLRAAGFSAVQSWQHLFEEHPYGAKYDAADHSDLIKFFILTASA